MITPDLITRSNRRTLSLSILKDGQIVVKAPLRLSNESIQKFVYDKQDWIRQKLSIIENNRRKFDDVISYRKFMLFGNQYSLKIANVKKIETAKDDLIIYMPSSIENDKILSRLKAWYKKQAKLILEERTAYLSSVLKLRPNAIRVSDSKGRWGSCNSKGNLSLNFRIVMLDPLVIDYVIIHELCHLVEMNHSKRFWSLVNSFMPSAPQAKNKIKEYSFILGLF